MKQIDLFCKSMAIFLFALSIASHNAASRSSLAYHSSHAPKPDFITDQPESSWEVILPKNRIDGHVSNKKLPSHKLEFPIKPEKKPVSEQNDADSGKNISEAHQKVGTIPDDVKIENLDEKKADDSDSNRSENQPIRKHSIKIKRMGDVPDTSGPN